MPVSLLLAARRLATELSCLLATAEPGHSVHGARRRIKQLRSLLRLLRPASGEATYREVNDALRAAADALAGQRRAEALVAAAGKLEAPATQGFWRSLADAHRTAHATAGDAAVELANARAALALTQQRLAAAGLSGAAELGADHGVADAYIAGYARARKRLSRGLASGDAGVLHAARKDVIHHLHHTELLQPGRRKRRTALEALREVLGDLNDLDELEQLAAGLAVPDGDRRRMRKARRRLLDRAGAAAARLFRRPPDQVRKRLRHAAGLVLPGNGLG